MRTNRLLPLSLVALGLVFAPTQAPATDWSVTGRPVDSVENHDSTAMLKAQLTGASDRVLVVQLADGSLAYLVQTHDNGTRLLTPSEFTGIVHAQQQGRSWLQILLNISSPAGIAWVVLGLGGQLLFTGRMLVQWIVSERDKRSVIPVAFWWMSLIGATMLLVYFIWRRDIVGVLGQATGWVIYIRNLMLIHRSRS